MIYRNSEIRMDQMITYLNEDKVNLSPVFQRGHVWKVNTRRKLVRNIVQGRPIPAIFIYKEPSGSRYSYNVLDGKQRLESLILFIGNQQQGSNGNKIALKNWAKYFWNPRDRKDANFWIELPEGRHTFKNLSENTVRDFGEYAIPTIEITLTDETPLDEIIDLFVDINQEGEPVKRFDVVKAIGKDSPMLQSVFDLIARQETRARDVFYKPKKNEFTFVLKVLSFIGNLPDSNAKVDRMWERLLEIASVVRTRKHRQPVEILKSFIKTRAQRDEKPEPALKNKEVDELRKLFRFLRNAYKAGLANTPVAKDQTHFYTMVTSIVLLNLFDAYDSGTLVAKLAKFGKLLDAPPKSGDLAKPVAAYLELSQRQTSTLSRREGRQKLFSEIIDAL